MRGWMITGHLRRPIFRGGRPPTPGITTSVIAEDRGNVARSRAAYLLSNCRTSSA